MLLRIEGCSTAGTACRPARKIKRDSPGTRVVLYTMNSPEAYDDAAMKRADSFVPKDRLFEELPGIVGKETPETKKEGRL